MGRQKLSTLRAKEVMEAASIAGFIASVLGSIGLTIAGLRYIIKLENIPIVSRLDKMESQLELALSKGVRNGNAKARK
jgi:hypothetical protein